MDLAQFDTVRAVEWRDNALYLLDQRRLPDEAVYLRLDSAVEVARAIKNMVVRGAPAIGIAAAYGAALAAREAGRSAEGEGAAVLESGLKALAESRPTAVNLFWALNKARAVLSQGPEQPDAALLDLAHEIHRQDVEGNRRMGAFGAALIEPGEAVLTHCNTGSLATGGFGTALGVIRAAFAGKKVKRVFADETRPWLQGARLTAWELVQDGIPVSLLADGAAAHLMKSGQVSWVIVGADRVAANGDAANKIGTYGLAIAARHHGVKFMVAAPTSTIDPKTATGDDIEIEMRGQEEVLTCGSRRMAAQGARAWNPVFDVTPAGLVNALVTEKGVIENPDKAKIAAHLSG